MRVTNFSLRSLLVVVLIVAVILSFARSTVRWRSCSIARSGAPPHEVGWRYEIAGWGYTLAVHTGDVPLPFFQCHRIYKEDGSRFWSVGWSR